ncbi:MAG: RNA polymerase sigma factor [Blastocatellia bacterium]
MSASPNTLSRKDRSLTKEGLDRLLESLDPDPESAARRYEELRRGLITFFTFRDQEDPAALADVTFNRAANSLIEGKEIFSQNPAAYFYAIARNVWLGNLARGRQTIPLPNGDHAFESERSPSPEDLIAKIEDRAASEQRLHYLDRCLQILPIEERELIIHYYQGSAGEKIANRQHLAERLGVRPAALRKRASRLRAKLADCLRNCNLEENPPK